MRGEHDRGMWLFGRERIDVGPVAFNRHPLALITQAAKFAEKKVSGFGLVAGDGFDVD